jgi:hypothetical protein
VLVLMCPVVSQLLGSRVGFEKLFLILSLAKDGKGVLKL